MFRGLISSSAVFVRRFAVATSVVVASVVAFWFGSTAMASESITVPNSMDPATLMTSLLTSLGNYIPAIVTLVLVVAIAIAAIAFVRRKPKAAIK
jgi:H+/Cl- antiporter ClcA